MTVDSYELGFIEYMAKFNEKLTFARLKMADGKDINEEEEILIKEIYRIYDSDRYPLYGTKTIKPDESSLQQGLFSQNVSTSDDGTKIVVP